MFEAATDWARHKSRLLAGCSQLKRNTKTTTGTNLESTVTPQGKVRQCLIAIAVKLMQNDPEKQIKTFTALPVQTT